MCRVFEETRREGAFQHAIEMALRMIEDGALPLDKVAQYSGLPLEKVQELAGIKTAKIPLSVDRGDQEAQHGKG